MDLITQTKNQHIQASWTSQPIGCLLLLLLDIVVTTLCLQKNCAKLFLSEFRQIFTNFDNFWLKDGKEAKIMRRALTFHLI